MYLHLEVKEFPYNVASLEGAIISKWNDLLPRLRQSNYEILNFNFAMRMQNTATLYTYQGIIRFYRSYYLVIYGNRHNKQLKIILFWRRDTRKKTIMCSLNPVFTFHLSLEYRYGENSIRQK